MVRCRKSIFLLDFITAGYSYSHSKFITITMVFFSLSLWHFEGDVVNRVTSLYYKHPHGDRATQLLTPRAARRHNRETISNWNWLNLTEQWAQSCEWKFIWIDLSWILCSVGTNGGCLYRNKEESKGVIDAIRIDLTPRLGCLLWTHVSLFYSMGLIGDIVCRHRRLINRERHTKRNPTHTLCILNNSCEKPRGGRVVW